MSPPDSQPTSIRAPSTSSSLISARRGSSAPSRPPGLRRAARSARGSRRGGPRSTVTAMSYIAREARQELLETVAGAAEEIGAALALVEAAYERLDEGNADRLEEQLFRPVQGAYGR